MRSGKSNQQAAERLPLLRRRRNHAAVLPIVRASDPENAVRAFGPDAKYLAGGTNLLDLMKEGVERPASLVDVSRLALTRIGPADRRPRRRSAVDRRSGEEQRHRQPSAREAEFSAAEPGDPRGGERSDPQHGDGGRQPEPADAVPLFLRAGAALQQAFARDRVQRARGRQPLHTRSSAGRDACVATHPSDMCVALAALDARVHTCSGPTARLARYRIRRLSSAAGR